MSKKRYYKSKYKDLDNRKQAIREEKKSFKKTMFYVALVIVISAIIYWLLFSPFFAIKKITISGIDQIGKMNDIENTINDFASHPRFFVFSQKNILVLNETSLTSLLKNKYDLESVEVKAEKNGNLKIEIKEKKPVAIWKSDNNFFTVYSDLRIKDVVTGIQTYELPIIGCGTTTQAVIGESYVNAKQMEYIDELFRTFKFYLKDVDIKEFVVINQRSREVTVVTTAGWKIYFSLELDVEKSLKNIKLVLDKKIENKNNLKYIDARIKDKIYYK